MKLKSRMKSRLKKGGKENLILKVIELVSCKWQAYLQTLLSELACRGLRMGLTLIEEFCNYNYLINTLVFSEKLMLLKQF